MIDQDRMATETGRPGGDASASGDVQHSGRDSQEHELAPRPTDEAIEEHLLAAVRKLTSTLDVMGVCDAILTGVERVFGASSSWIMLHDPAANVLRTALFRGRGADVYAAVEIAPERGVVGHVFSSGETLFVADAASEDGWFDADRVHSSGLQSVVLIPLVASGRHIGVLGLDAPRFSRERPPRPLDVKRLQIFAAQAAVGLTNARLYQTSLQDQNRLRALLRERRTLRREVLTLRDEVRNAHSFGQIVGDSAAMRQALLELDQVAGSDVTVLLLGETGTGKELLARALHERSPRSSRPFVPVNCAALPESLVESEMFGHERGAFTGAHARKPGRFELAHRGTLFLDEVGDLPLNAQAKLLRVLQDREVHRVGSTAPIKVDVRLVAATNRDLSAAVAGGEFREDLFYRLSVFPIRIPPLRERPEDIPALAQHLAVECARRIGKRLTGIELDALQALQGYAWPGNVRELQNVMERAVILAPGGLITAETIRVESLRPPAPEASADPRQGGATPDIPLTLAEAERLAILEALRHAQGRVSGPGGAAALLRVKPTTLHAKMKKLGIRRSDAVKPSSAGD
jgi:formate hydrogenlyase transcriptional activator